MKQVNKNSITNIEWTYIFDNKFLFKVLCTSCTNSDINHVQVVHISDLLEKRKNLEMLKKAKEKPAIYSNVYSPKDELEIFEGIFNNAVNIGKKVHIVWVTLKEEIDILEKYYEELGFIREEINCFDVDFSVPLVTVSVNIENLMWKWSDYKRMRDKIFFKPPVRESGQVKAMFKWINRWVVAWINIKNFGDNEKQFLGACINEEKILPITLAKILKYNLEDIWFEWNEKEFIIEY